MSRSPAKPGCLPATFDERLWVTMRSPAPRLSVIVPAFNEERRLPACLASIREAAAAEGLDPEVIVADNNSTDATSELARAAGAAVVFEPFNQISRARNAGAARATGDWLLFLDADSCLHRETLADLLGAMGDGRCAGGGCLVAFDRAPWWGRVGVGLWNLISRTMRWAAGSFVFCRADVFAEIGGFSREMYAAEELDFSRRLKAWAASHDLVVTILKARPHVSSGRKLHLYSHREILLQTLRLVFRFRRTVRQRSRLRYFYDGRR